MHATPQLVRCPRRNAGFTLLELMTAMAVAALLIAMLLNAFKQTNNAWTAGEAQVESYQMGRALLDLFAQDLSQARVTTNFPFEATAAGVIDFYAANAVAGAFVNSDLARIVYNTGSIGTAGGILRQATTNSPTATLPTAQTILLTNLVTCSFSYYYVNAFGTLNAPPQASWSRNSTNAPAAVLVTLGILDSRSADKWWLSKSAAITNAYLRTFSEMIYLPCSQP